MATKKSRAKRISFRLDEILTDIKTRNGIKYTEASDMVANLLMEMKIKNGKAIKVKRELEF